MSRRNIVSISNSKSYLDKHGKYLEEDLKNYINKFNKISSLSYSGVKKLEKKFLSNITLEKLSTIIEFLSISMYYFDNNYHTQLNNFLQKVQPNKDFFCIDDYIKDFDKTIQLYIKSRFLPLDIYITFFKEEKTLETFKIIPEKFSQYLKDLQSLDKELINNNVDIFFSVINTYVSYLNYFIPFILQCGDYDLLNSYLLKANSLLEILLNNIEIKNLHSLKKVVFISNLRFLHNLAIKLNKTPIINYKNYLSDIDDINIDYKAFLLDYAKLEINLGKLLDVEIDFPGFIDLLDEKDLYSKASFLEDYAGHLTVRKFSHLFKTYLQQKNKVNNGRTYMAVNYYSDLLVEYIKEHIKDLSIDEFILTIKFILIKLLNLEAVNKNLKVNLKINDLNKHIKYTNTKTNDKKYKNLIFSNKYSFSSISIEIEVYANINIDKTNLQFIEKKIDRIINLFFDKIDKLNLFINSIELKIKKLSDHPETILHMERLGKIMFILLDNLPEEKKVLTSISNSLSLKFTDFLKNLGYLHDIGKADNLHNLLLYENFNGRTFPIGQLLFILNDVFEGKQIENISEEKLTVSNKSSINMEYLYLLGTDTKITNIIENHFLNMFSPDKYIINSISPSLKSHLFFTVGEVFKYIQENIDIDPINILSSEKAKELLVQKLNNYFEKNFIYLDFEINTENIDLFIFSLFVFLQSYSSIAQKNLTTPHIIYGMHFFQSHPEFNHLNWVLLHHKNYPNINEMKKYDLFKGLKNFCKLAKTDPNILDKYKDIDKGVFNPEDKDIYTVLISVVDLIDALLGRRKYQNNFDTNIDIYSYIFKIFSKNFLELFVEFQIKGEKLLDKNKIFEKIIKILDSEFLGNKNWPKIKQVLIEKKDEILNLYK